MDWAKGSNDAIHLDDWDGTDSKDDDADDDEDSSGAINAINSRSSVLARALALTKINGLEKKKILLCIHTYQFAKKKKKVCEKDACQKIYIYICVYNYFFLGIFIS